MKRMKLFLRDAKHHWHVGYYDKCQCGYSCDKHFRVVSSFPKIEIKDSYPFWLIKMVAEENPVQYTI